MNAPLARVVPITLLALLLVPVSLHAADDETGFTSIFNGKDLTGWDCEDGHWTVADGAITCTGTAKERNWIIWRGGEPGDFELRLKFKWTKGNSGVQVRSHIVEDHPHWVQGYQVEVAEQSKMGLWHHSFSPETYRHSLALAGEKSHYAADGTKTVDQVADAAKIKASYREDAWNDMTVIAQGPRLVQIINGVTFSEIVDEDAKYAMSKGLIALQDHGKGCAVAFKDIRIKVAE
ncbi:MAG: DUF1080 domain-containing protein [Phycisphaera sp.]|nr:DUF1080 domain-containing protein [Phycisphaera sp.]